MKPLVTMMILAVLGIAAAEEPEAVVRFSNNDRLTGTLAALSSDLLVWQSPVLAKPTAFFLKNIMDLTLPATTPAPSADHEATLKLTNGDSVCGQLAAVTDDTIAIDTWFAGRLIIPRVMVAGVTIADQSALIYRGPTSLDGWRQAVDNPAWTYSRSAFHSRAAGSLTRDKLLAEECAITFDVAWKGDALGLKVLVFADEPSAGSTAAGYEISFQRGNIYLALKNGRSSQFIGSTQSQVLMENDKARIELRASLKSGKFCLLINDRMLEVWSDPEAGKGRYGRGLSFSASQNTSQLRISGINITPWDGVAEQMAAPRQGMRGQLERRGLTDTPQPAPPDKPPEGRMELANGDSLEGEVLTIANGMIQVKTPLGEVKLPVARLRSLALKQVALERCKRRNGDIRGWFADGSSIVFRLEGVAADTLLGSSQNFGTATFRTAAFNRIEFNIHDPALDDQRLHDEW